MGGGGSIQGFNTSLKNNRKLLRKTSFFPKERSFLNSKREYIKRAGGVKSLKNASKEELLAIRESIIAKRRKDNLLTVAIFIILVAATIYISIDYYKAHSNIISQKKKIELKENLAEYNFYISDGDSYLEKGQWHNAIFQYDKALEIFPNDYSANYRLVYAQVYRCRNTKVNCDQANRNVQKLLEQFPEKPELIELEHVLIFAESE